MPNNGSPAPFPNRKQTRRANRAVAQLPHGLDSASLLGYYVSWSQSGGWVSV